MIKLNELYDEMLARHGMKMDSGEHTLMETQIIENWNKIKHADALAIWGVGKHTEELFEFLPEIRKKTQYLIDRNPQYHGSTKWDIPVFGPERLQLGDVQAVIISTMAFRDEIKDFLAREYPSVIAVDLYDGLDNVNVPFYYPNRFSHDLFVHKQKYLETGDAEAYLFPLICRYLDIYDFVNARRYANLYPASGPRHDQIRLFFKELDAFLDEVKQHVQQVKHRHIALIVIDSLRAKDVYSSQEKMPYLHALSKKSLTFDNCFSTSTYTHTAIHSMLTETLSTDFTPDDDEKYDIPIDSSRLLQFLLHENYQVFNYSVLDFFGSDPRTARVHCKKQQEKRGKKLNAPASAVMWNYLANLLSGEQNSFALLHLSETHTPHICSNHSRFSTGNYPVNYYTMLKRNPEIFSIDNYRFQYEECLAYIDEQMAFYLELMPSNAMLVICGDHGQAVGEYDAFGHIYTWYDEVIHVPLIIKANQWQGVRISKLFSMENFSELMMQLLRGEELDPPESDLVFMFREKLYNPVFLSNIDFMQALGSKFAEAFLVVRSMKDKFVRCSSGDEEYYLLPDESRNLIHEPEYRERIDWLRSRCEAKVDFGQLTASAIAVDNAVANIK